MANMSVEDQLAKVKRDKAAREARRQGGTATGPGARSWAPRPPKAGPARERAGRRAAAQKRQEEMRALPPQERAARGAKESGFRTGDVTNPSGVPTGGPATPTPPTKPQPPTKPAGRRSSAAPMEAPLAARKTSKTRASSGGPTTAKIPEVKKRKAKKAKRLRRSKAWMKRYGGSEGPDR